MRDLSSIDTNFNFNSDSLGKDPDIYSPTLRRYHKLLWSKPLPNGVMFQLDDTVPGVYLRHKSALGDFVVSSDRILPTFTNWKRLAPITDLVSDHEREELDYLVNTIGATIIWPGNRIDGLLTINGARGFNRKIADRFDLTLECIRRHYLNVDSPLAETFRRYSSFFELFGDFKGYVDFFVLNDLVALDYSAVIFFLPNEDFTKSPVPGNFQQYEQFRLSTRQFVNARNHRLMIEGLRGRT